MEEKAFDPRKRRAPRPGVGGPPPKELLGDPAPRTSLAVVEPEVGEGNDDGRLPGRQRRPGSREIHVTLSERAYALLEVARKPGTSYGDLIAAALREAKATLMAERPAPAEDPLDRPPRTQRLYVEGRTRSRPFNVTPAQADAIRALAEEVGIPNISELVDRSVLLTYGSRQPLTSPDAGASRPRRRPVSP
jgi:hypothetical protein